MILRLRRRSMFLLEEWTKIVGRLGGISCVAQHFETISDPIPGLLMQIEILTIWPLFAVKRDGILLDEQKIRTWDLRALLEKANANV